MTPCGVVTTLSSRIRLRDWALCDRNFHDLDASRLGRDRCVPLGDAAARILLSAAVGPDHGRLLRLGAAGHVVVGRHVHGGHNLCGGYPAGGDRAGLYAGNRGELAVVEFSAFRHDDRVPVRTVMAAVWLAYGRAVCGNALRGKTGSILEGVPGGVPGPANELFDSGLGHQGDDQHRGRGAG